MKNMERGTLSFFNTEMKKITLFMMKRLKNKKNNIPFIPLIQEAMDKVKKSKNIIIKIWQMILKTLLNNLI